MHRFSFPGMSYNSIFGLFMVFITDPEICRTSLAVNGTDSLLMAIHPAGKVRCSGALSALRFLFMPGA